MATPISTFFVLILFLFCFVLFLMVHVREVMLSLEDKKNLNDMSFMCSGARQLYILTSRKCTCANTRIRARAHTHTLSFSLLWHMIMHLSCTIIQIKQRSDTQIKITLNSITFTYYKRIIISPKSLVKSHEAYWVL